MALVRCSYKAIGLQIKVLASAKSETVRCGGFRVREGRGCLAPLCRTSR